MRDKQGRPTEEEQSTGRLEALIEDLILFSLASRGELSIQHEIVDLRRLVNLSTKAYTTKAEERTVSLNVIIDEDVPHVQADPQKIAWVLNQLLDNGIKFTPSGGRVAVAASEEGASVKLTVSDNGPGIPPGELGRIFDKFHQVRRPRGPGGPGSGLGLPISRQLVEMHGGRLTVESVQGKGSTFTVVLPASEDHGEPSAAERQTWHAS